MLAMSATYSAQMAEGIAAIDRDRLNAFVDMLDQLGRSGGRLLLAGNGGSASMANHMACDIVKGTYVKDVFRLRAMSLVANQALYTAVANDFGHDDVFARQVEMTGDQEDVLMLISSSGNSANIIRGMDQAQSMGMSVIGLTGFDGGKLAKGADLSLHVPVHNYGVVEDCHMMLVHMACQIINGKYDKA